MSFALSALSDGRFAVEVPADSPLYSGHFPDRPILPGICHLAFVAQALRGRAVREIAYLKLRRQVTGAARLELTIDGPTVDGEVRFASTRDGESVAHGRLRLAPLDWLGAALQPASRDGSAIGSSIPHHPPARLIASTIDMRERGITCLASIPADHPLAAEDRAPAFLALEAGAQAAAVFEAMTSEAPAPRIGYLVGLRDARLDIASLPVDTPFAVSAELVGSAPPLAQYQIDLDGLVSGAISTYVPDEISSALQPRLTGP